MRNVHGITALIAASLATAAAAEPAKAPVQQADRPPAASTIAVVASAEPVRAPEIIAAEQRDAAPAKRVRTARVTTCRCGGQAPPPAN